MDRLIGPDIGGGKLLAASATEYLDALINPDLWQDEMLHMPQPRSAEFVLADHLQSEDEDEEFWSDRLDGMSCTESCHSHETEVGRQPRLVRACCGSPWSEVADSVS